MRRSWNKQPCTRKPLPAALAKILFKMGFSTRFYEKEREQTDNVFLRPVICVLAWQNLMIILFGWPA